MKKQKKHKTKYVISPPRLCPVCKAPLIFDVEYRYLACTNECTWNHTTDEVPRAFTIGTEYHKGDRPTHYRVEGIAGAEFVRSLCLNGLQAYRLDKNGRRMDGLFLELLPPERWILNKSRKCQRPKKRAPKLSKVIIRKQAHETARLQAEVRTRLAEHKRQAHASKPCPEWAVNLIAKHNQ